PHLRHEQLTGISVGRGQISARLYNKPLEIQTKSHKFWMFDVWGVQHVPDDLRIIRVEVQLRREKLKALGINLLADLWAKEAGLWAYCTQRWLKLQTGGPHHTQRRTVPWWSVVEAGYAGAQGAEPLVIEKAVRATRERLMKQILGLL